MIGLNKIGLNQVQLNRLRLNAPFPAYGKMAGGGGSGDGFPQLPGDVTRWHFGGLTNEMMAAMDDPRIEDADGKGRFLSFKNFAWKGMSGVGGYGDENHLTFYKFALDDYVFIAIKPGVKHMNFTFRVTGLQPGNKLTLAFFGTTNTVYGTWDKDGIYTVKSAVVEVGKPVYFYNGYGSTRGEFTIEILPLYPGALVFDGVDDYGTCDNFPILTKEKGYTVVALRQWISMGEGLYGLVSNVKNWFNDGAFVLEYNSNNATNKFVNRPVSFGNVNIEMDLPNNFTYQTSKSYKGVPITTGSFKGTNSLFVGKLNNIIGNCSNVAILELVFLDHDATEEELTKIKNYFVKTYPWLFPDQAWTVTGKTNEDEDRATIANITGNGNDLILSNFGFAEGSGYNEEGEYAGYLVTDGVDDRVISSSFTLNKDWTIVGNWKMLQPEANKSAGIVKQNSLFIYNHVDGLSISINAAYSSFKLKDIRSVNAICSDGRIYLNDWTEIIDSKQQTVNESVGTLVIGILGNVYTSLAFKNLGFYNNQILSKDDCIKAYNYLQTLKAK